MDRNKEYIYTLEKHIIYFYYLLHGNSDGIFSLIVILLEIRFRRKEVIFITIYLWFIISYFYQTLKVSKNMNKNLSHLNTLRKQPLLSAPDP